MGTYHRDCSPARGKGQGQVDANELITQYESGERDFAWVNLYQADLGGAVLSKAVPYHINLSKAYLKGAAMPDGTEHE